MNNQAVDLYLELVSTEDPLPIIERELSAIKGIKIISFKPQIFAIADSTADKPSILLTAHTDVKNIAAAIHDENGVIWGSGADDRAGIAAILAALKSIDTLPHGRIGVLFSYGEEKGCLGAYEFFRANTIHFDYTFSVDGNGRSGNGFFPYYKALGYELDFEDEKLYNAIIEANESTIKSKKGKLVRVGNRFACSLTIRAADKEKLAEYFLKSKDICISFDGDLPGKACAIKKKEFGFLPEKRDLIIPDLIKNAYSK